MDLLLIEKREMAQTLEFFFTMVRTQFHKQVKVVRTDNITEFIYLKLYFLENGRLHQTSMVHTTQPNGRVERRYRHILIVALALLFQANLSVQFWRGCVLTAGYLINHTPSSMLKGKTQFELLFNKVPSYSHIKNYGCLAYVHDHGLPKDKFRSRGQKCIWISIWIKRLEIF